MFLILIMEKAPGNTEHTMFTEESFFRFGGVFQLRQNYQHIHVPDAPLKNWERFW